MIFVTGASGQLGGLVADGLAERVDPSTVTLGTRSPEKLSAYKAKGFNVVAFDFDDPAGMTAALHGHDRMLLISGSTDIETRKRQQRAAIDAAKAAGVSHIVYTSFANASDQSKFTFAWIHADTEGCLAKAGLGYTILRNNNYADLQAGAIEEARKTGRIALPGHAGKCAYITRADAAAAAVAALLADNPGNAVLDITGPAAYSAKDLAAMLTEIWGKPVEAVEIDSAAFEDKLAPAGFPPFYVEAFHGIRGATGDGEYESVSDDFEKLTGRKAEDFKQVVKRLA
ncbi:NAD(P)H-binding protein [Cucumibacter marinus]|uniref:NAD(P)H-binding protein n=1 Tax=Cucumibacter marinus TaxID=1121252 RepID=UPI0004079D93|nr:NAD(P)H-binding protein [Cucumibacter marinus]